MECFESSFFDILGKDKRYIRNKLFIDSSLYICYN